MNRKYLPLILMLSAGAVTCVISLIRKDTMLHQLILLFVVLMLFYFLGSVVQWTLDYFERENEKKAVSEGEVIEKQTQQQETQE